MCKTRAAICGLLFENIFHINRCLIVEKFVCTNGYKLIHMSVTVTITASSIHQHYNHCIITLIITAFLPNHPSPQLHYIITVTAVSLHCHLFSLQRQLIITVSLLCQRNNNCNITVSYSLHDHTAYCLHTTQKANITHGMFH